MKSNKIFILIFILITCNNLLSSDLDETEKAMANAIANNHPDIVKSILDKHPNLNKKENLSFAAAVNRPEFIKLILDKYPDADASSALWSAANDNYTDIVKLILEKQPTVNANHALSTAASNNNLEIIKLILEKQPNIDIDVALSLDKDHPDIVKLINDFNEYKKVKQDKKGYEESIVSTEDLKRVHHDIHQGTGLPKDLAGLTSEHLYLTFDDYLKNKKKLEKQAKSEKEAKEKTE